MTDIAAVVAAAATSRGIGSSGDLVWRIPADMNHFKKVTMTPPTPTAVPSDSLMNAVIMGRKTWESIPPKFRPLENRVNVILSRSPSYTSSLENDKNVIVCASLKEAISRLELRKKEQNNIGLVFLIGGGEVYKEGMASGLINKVIYTMVDNLSQEQEDSFDTWFPELKNETWTCLPYPGEEVKDENEDVTEKEKTNTEDNGFLNNAIVHMHQKSGIKYQFLEYIRKQNKSESLESIEEGARVNPEEMQYLEMCREIIEHGVHRGDRTGTGTLSKFGTQMRFSLRDGTLPLLTTKRTFWRGVAEELLWFVAVSRIVIISLS
jgi:dihydrofolate reductase/thymidylate synthase